MEKTIKSSPSFFMRGFELVQKFPFLKYLFFKLMYGVMSRASKNDKALIFLNYGYSDPSLDASLSLSEEDERYRYSIQMYEHVVGDESLVGKDVLEVGSGRGGGASYIARYRKPRMMTAIDLSNTQAKFASKRHVLDNLTFKQGNAMKLPFGEAALDAVVNVESSHCYPSLDGFYQEVFRVLRPGGAFLYGDFVPVGSLDSAPDTTEVIEQKLRAVGFEIERLEDITEGVVAGLDKTEEEKVSKFQSELKNPLVKTTLSELLATRGSRSYKLFEEKVSVFFVIRARKPAQG